MLPAEISAMIAREVAVTLCMSRSVTRIKAGTITKPPPTPNSDDSTPVAKPARPSARAQAEVQRRRPTRGSIRHGAAVARARGDLPLMTCVARRNIRPQA